MEKKRRRKKRLRHKKSKLSSDDILVEDISQRQRRKSFRRADSIVSSQGKNEKNSSGKVRRPNIILIMTDDQVKFLGVVQFLWSQKIYFLKLLIEDFYIY